MINRIMLTHTMLYAAYNHLPIHATGVLVPIQATYVHLRRYARRGLVRRVQLDTTNKINSHCQTMS